MMKANWKSSLSGIIVLMGVVVHAINDPKVLQDPMTISTIVAGIGLLMTKDATTKDLPK